MTKKIAKHQPKPKAEQPKPQAKVQEQPLGFIDRGYVLSEFDRRAAYALSEKGEVLVIDSSGPTYSVIRALDGSVLLAPGQSAATIKTRARTVDSQIP
jgi:6-phosphofructokinase